MQLSCLLKSTMSVESVARIAYLSSEVVVDSQLSGPSTSQFTETYRSLLKVATHKPTVVRTPFGADPGSTLLRYASDLTTFTAIATSQVVIRLALHLAELSTSPVVLHFAVQEDLSEVLFLRSAVPFFILSQTPQEAHDNALLAARLARVEHKAVVHAFFISKDRAPVDEIAEDKIFPFLLGKKHPPSPSSPVSPVTPLNDPNGLTNGHANGHANGQSATSGPVDDPIATQLVKAYEAAALDTLSLVRRPKRALTVCGASDSHTVIFLVGKGDFAFHIEGVSYVTLSLLNPLPASRVATAIPDSAKNVIVLEQVHKWTTKWTPLYLELVSTIQHRNPENPLRIRNGILGEVENVTAPDVLELIQRAATPGNERVRLGAIPNDSASSTAPHIPKHESAYTRILDHLFKERLDIVNSPSLIASQGEISTTPEFALGRVRGQLVHLTAVICNPDDGCWSPGLSSYRIELAKA